MTLYTTIRLADAACACIPGLRWARKWVDARDGDDDTPIPLVAILDDAPAERALEWTIWSLRAVPAEQEGERDRLARLIACDCAERVLPLFEARHPGDGRPRAAIEVARRFAIGTAGADELDAAWAAAGAAAGAAEAAWQADRLRAYLTGAELAPVEATAVTP